MFIEELWFNIFYRLTSVCRAGQTMFLRHLKPNLLMCCWGNGAFMCLFGAEKKLVRDCVFVQYRPRFGEIYMGEFVTSS